MEAQESTLSSAQGAAPQRVVEFELRLPRREEITLPKMDWAPWRRAAEQALVTGLGVGILVARGVRYAVKAAYEAGSEAAAQPDSVTHTLVGWMHPQQAEAQPASGKIRVLPLEDYERLTSDEVIARLPQLTAAQLETVRAYELEHERRTSVLKAIDELLTTV